MDKLSQPTNESSYAAMKAANTLYEIDTIYPITPTSPMGKWANKWSTNKQNNSSSAIPKLIEIERQAGSIPAGLPAQKTQSKKELKLLAKGHDNVYVPISPKTLKAFLEDEVHSKLSKTIACSPYIAHLFDLSKHQQKKLAIKISHWPLFNFTREQIKNNQALLYLYFSNSNKYHKQLDTNRNLIF